jgi:hypothetical protein
MICACSILKRASPGGCALNAASYMLSTILFALSPMACTFSW